MPLTNKDRHPPVRRGEEKTKTNGIIGRQEHQGYFEIKSRPCFRLKTILQKQISKMKYLDIQKHGQDESNLTFLLPKTKSLPSPILEQPLKKRIKIDRAVSGKAQYLPV